MGRGHFWAEGPRHLLALTQPEPLGSLDGALNAAPAARKAQAKDYLFVLLFEQGKEPMVSLPCS